MFQPLKFLRGEIRFHVWGIPLESVGVVLVGGAAFPTVPILFWKDERVGALPKLNPVVPPGIGFGTPALITAAAYLSQESSKEGKPKESCHPVIISPLLSWS